MSQQTKRRILISCILLALVCVGAYLAWPPRRAVSAVIAQALRDVGRFRLGSALGEERAGFSGRTKVLVFADSTEIAALDSCLKSAEVESHMDFFTGVLIDDKVEPDVEADLRAQGVRVIVRGLQGQVLGLLPEGYTCRDLAALLEQVRANSTHGPEKSPIYVNLLERPTEVMNDFIQRGDSANAVKYATYMEEFEGSQSPAVKAAKATVGR